jgi:predicted house-cleaning noncanonical NTP pyrophosphatase (MazG superfamily)
MLDIASARLRTHRNNIARYRRLLETKLTELERDYIQRRLSEEQSDLEALGSVAPAFNTQGSKIAKAS